MHAHTHTHTHIHTHLAGFLRNSPLFSSTTMSDLDFWEDTLSSRCTGSSRQGSGILGSLLDCFIGRKSTNKY